MGAKYDFSAAFAGCQPLEFQYDVATVGFGKLWKLFDSPTTLSLQNYERCTVVNLPFDRTAMAAAAFPGTGDIFAIYTESRLSSLMFFRDGRYFVAVASVEESRLARELRRKMYEEFKESLRPFHPLVMATGEEWELSEPVIADLLAGRLPPREVEFYDCFSLK